MYYSGELRDGQYIALKRMKHREHGRRIEKVLLHSPLHIRNLMPYRRIIQRLSSRMTYFIRVFSLSLASIELYFLVMQLS